MNAYEIAWDAAEERVALGWGSGLVSVHAREEDGAPGEERSRIGLHDAPIVLLGWVGDRVVSVDHAGVWALSDAASGEVLRQGSVGGEYVRASLAPGGSALFVFTYRGSATCVRIDLATGETTERELPAEVSVESRVYALSERRALFHFVQTRYGDDPGTSQGFVDVDLGADTTAVRTFARGPKSDFDSETLLLAIDAARGLGVRADYTPPVVEEGRVPFQLEVFDVETLEARRTLRVGSLPAEAITGPSAAVLTAEPGSDEHREALDWFLKILCSARFAGDQIWVTLQGGVVVPLPLDGSGRGPLVIHGGAADTGPPTLDDVFARNLRNNFTLGVSPSGRFVGFSNPNDFFDATKLEGERVQLPRRERDVVEAPGCVCFASDLLVVSDRGRGLHLVSPDLSIERIELPELYGFVSDAALGEDGRWLVLAVSGGGALAVDRRSGQLHELPVPPHSILAEMVGSSRALFVHHNAAVVSVDLEEQTVTAVRVGEGGELEEGWDAFEQRWDVYAAALVRGASMELCVLDENDELQRYTLTDDGFEPGPTMELGARRLAGGEGILVSASDDEAFVLNLDGGESRALEVSAPHAVGVATDGALLVLDGRAVRRIDGDEQQTLHELEERVARVSFCRDGRRFAVVAADGRIHLHSGETREVLRLEPSGDERTLRLEPATN